VSRALIVTYHAVEQGPAPLCVDPGLFLAHVEALVSAGARALSISELVEELRSPTSDDRLVALTFDDGFASVARNAAPILAARSLPATVFCVAGHIGGRNDWATNPPGGLESALLSADEVNALVSGGFEIGSHGFEHAPVPEANGEELERELVGSKEALERLTGTEIRSYAYPYGALPGAQVRSQVERTYVTACTTRVGFVGRSPDVYALPRVDAHYLRRPELFARAVEGSLGPYLAARRFGAQARRRFRKDYVSTRPAERTKR